MTSAALSTTPAPANPAADPAWKGVYRLGGISMLLAGALFLIVAIPSMMIGPPPAASDAYLNAVAGHARLSRFVFSLFAATDFLLLPAVLALYLALRHISRNAMLVASGLLALYIVLDLAVTELNSLTLVTLTEQCAGAHGDAQRSACLAAAHYALATLPLATFYSFLVSSIGCLIAALVMLKGVFSKITACAGILAGVEGILGSFYFAVPALAMLLVPSLIAFGVWSVMAGFRLTRLAASA